MALGVVHCAGNEEFCARQTRIPHRLALRLPCSLLLTQVCGLRFAHEVLTHQRNLTNRLCASDTGFESTVRRGGRVWESGGSWTPVRVHCPLSISVLACEVFHDGSLQCYGSWCCVVMIVQRPPPKAARSLTIVADKRGRPDLVGRHEEAVGWRVSFRLGVLNCRGFRVECHGRPAVRRLLRTYRFGSQSDSIVRFHRAALRTSPSTTIRIPRQLAILDRGLEHLTV